jgi:hypothetical protein
MRRNLQGTKVQNPGKAELLQENLLSLVNGRWNNSLINIDAVLVGFLELEANSFAVEPLHSPHDYRFFQINSSLRFPLRCLRPLR